MNEAEVLNLFQRIKIRWPSWQAPTPELLDIAIEVYLEDLGGYEYDAVKAAYKSLKASAFAPSLAEVVAELAPADVGEAWMVNSYDKLKPGDFFFKEDPMT